MFLGKNSKFWEEVIAYFPPLQFVYVINVEKDALVRVRNVVNETMPQYIGIVEGGYL
jgi:hypothetical protein